MGYTISQIAERTGLTTHTLRYYDKQGLLPFVDRDKAGNRDFKESDFVWLDIITCLKKSGMPVKQIRTYINMCMEGDATLTERLETFEAHKKAVLEKLNELTKYLKKIDFKIDYYKTAIDAGTEAIHAQTNCTWLDVR
ncbi:MerR family transcriptional regulator [Paenibacillus radicis (ex Gao et al. 2016)]|uniref:Transcriptional regulator n=1 Tax=Paenibacillus radicis (ex Gao et al. 2016) TaxID=1737354 RepID=A0A917LRB9_9BACL|nr:MerR family transcriptional regulator [Paenibacillus radicis (ex Gao et al. 2016)]GGG53066.1 transcriptional regulator [Paenibacillus radicis (ex Gao et al. 2016)]